MTIAEAPFTIPRRGKMLLAAAVILGTIPFLPWHSAQSEHYADIRLSVVSAQLQQVHGPYVLFVGDSHVERSLLPRLCGRPVINAGFSGLRLGQIETMIRRMPLPQPPDLVIVAAGTNDLQRRRHPLSRSAMQAFDSAAASVLGRLTAMAPTVALAIPPMHEAASEQFAQEIAPLYSEVLRGACEAAGCHFVQPFSGTATAGLPIQPAIADDGVHLVDYAAPISHAERDICRGIAPANDTM